MELFWDTLVGAEVARIATALIKVVVLGVLASLALSWVARRTDRMADRLHIEPLIAELAITALKVFLFLFVLISALSSLGVQTNTLLAAVGAAGLAIGLALQSSLSNLAAGILLAVNKIFKKADYIEANGVAGSVTSIGLFTTTLRTIDNRSVTVPNDALFSNNIVNYSRFPIRRIDLRVSIAYEDDVQVACQVLTDLLNQSDAVVDRQDVVVGVESFGEYGVNLLVRCWVGRDNLKATEMTLLAAIKQAFDQQGITIPYPRVDISGLAEFSRALAQGQSEAERAGETVIGPK